MTNSIDTGNISDSEGIAIGRDAKSYVMNQHFYGTKHHFYGAKRPSYKPPQLPNLNSIPPPAKLPPYSRMILNRNQYFTGRNEQLKFLAEHLLYTTRPQSTAVIIHGIGGVGKTQLATEFVYRYGQFFEGGVFWLSFADKTVIPAEIVSCGGMMAIRPDFYDMSLKDQIQMVKNEWADGKKRLLIFDNCEEPTLLKNERLLGGDCRILITSRWADWGKTEGNKTLKLKKFPRKRSVELLRNLSNIQKPENDMTLNKIAEKLGDLPLALHLAACFLAAYGEVISPEDYLKQLSEKNTLSNKSMEGQGVQDNPTNHYLHVEKTFDISYEKLDHNDSLAHELLIRLAYFAPGEPVLYELLLATLDSAREDNSLLDFLEAIKRLTNLGLIEQEAKKHVKIHRLITEFIHLKPKKDSPQTVVENVLLIKAIEANKIGVPSRLFSWQTHLLHLTDAAIGSKSKKAADLCIQTSNHLDSIGNYPEARIYLESALEIREQQFKPDYPDIIKILSHLGNLSRVMEDFEKAISCFQRTLELREKIHGPNHPDLGFSFDNLGNLFLAMRQYDEARLNFERSLELRDQQLGSGHHETALSLDNLGTLLQIMGNYKEALSYYEKSLTIREKQLGLAHADTAISLNKIGGVVELMNNYQMALANYRRALQIREQLFKPDHPLIAQSLNNLGFLLHLLGEYPEASLYLKRALNIRKHNLDPGHPETAISYNNFGYLLQSMGKYDEAQDNFENALKILKTISSFEHPHTKTVHKNMAKNEFLLQLNELDTIWSQISVIEKLSANDIDMTKSDMKEIFIEATKQSPRVNRVRRRLEDVKDIAKEMNEEAKFYLKLNSIIDSLILKASNIY